MKFLLIVLVLFISGCIVCNHEWSGCDEACAANGGVLCVSITFPDRLCECDNGATFKISEVKK